MKTIQITLNYFASPLSIYLVPQTQAFLQKLQRSNKIKYSHPLNGVMNKAIGEKAFFA